MGERLIDLIPEELRQAHEDGNVVFFCGAGVSVPAGLCLFAGLVEKILDRLAPDQSKAPLPWKAYKDEKYDEALDILERHEQGGFGKEIRDLVQEILTQRVRTLEPHKTLVRLADLDKPEGRLVTTNFDHLFEKALNSIRREDNAKYKKLVDVAPTLPPPKVMDWHTLVYLHGKLGHSINNQNLILTTADFGAAYLLDRWASRFVTELFRSFHVVFIGYRVEDPTMRYLVSALAAARDNKEHYKEAFSFASYGENGEYHSPEEAIEAWKIKGVRALPYDNVLDNHHELWDTLKKWAADHRGGLLSRRRIAARYGQYPPTGKDDEVLSELIWALKDPGVSKYIAELEAADRMHPGWVGHLQHKGLLGLPICKNQDNELINAPLVSHILPDHLSLNHSTYQLGRWISACLDSEDVLNWALKQGCVLHGDLRKEIQHRLKQTGVHDIAVGLKKIWHVLASDYYAHKLSAKNTHGYPYNPRVDSRDIFSQRNFIDHLRPIPIFSAKSNYFRGLEGYKADVPTTFCDIEIHLSGVSGSHDIESYKKYATDWDVALAVMAEDITTLLNEAMEWKEFFGLATADEDRSYIELPSISPHEQNRRNDHFSQLISMARESFDALQVANPQAAERLAHRWLSLDYPVFRRLVLYAATG